MANETSTPPPTLTRWYIDTRPLTLSTTTLPLLTTLQEPDQTAVQKFYHPKDKHMSLASNLLKYLFIHRTCRVPWSSIVISRTPDPHRRPCFIPDPSQSDRNPVNIEFNVSHQASIVAIAGTTIPANLSVGDKHAKPEVGIDITCVNERQGRSGEERNLASLYKYIGIFSEVFSEGEIEGMKRLHGAPSSSSSNTITGNSDDRLTEYGYRLFYTYWALKEAYIKMTGEALLASWLRELEFSNVIAPAPAAETGEGIFGEPYTGVKTTLNKNNVDDVRIEVVALESNYLFATAARGGSIGAGSRPDESEARSQDQDQDPWMPFKKLDIERDIRPCATGVCSCVS